MASPIRIFSQRILYHSQRLLQRLLQALPLMLLLERTVLCRMVFQWRRCSKNSLGRRRILPLPVRPPNPHASEYLLIDQGLSVGTMWSPLWVDPLVPPYIR